MSAAAKTNIVRKDRLSAVVTLVGMRETCGPDHHNLQRPTGRRDTGQANPCSAVQRDQREVRAAMGWEDLDWPRELKPPT